MPFVIGPFASSSIPAALQLPASRSAILTPDGNRALPIHSSKGERREALLLMPCPPSLPAHPPFFLHCLVLFYCRLSILPREQVKPGKDRGGTGGGGGEAEVKYFDGHFCHGQKAKSTKRQGHPTLTIFLPGVSTREPRPLRPPFSVCPSLYRGHWGTLKFTYPFLYHGSTVLPF